MEGIRARNTTGYDATRRVKTFIEYRKDETYEYEEVRRVNTKKPGDYRITYKLTDEIGRKTSVRVIHKVLKRSKNVKLNLGGIDMKSSYNPKEIEKKWQKIWEEKKAFAATDDYSKPKFYALVEFPYPSGQGLHVGHPRPYTALDIVARKRRMQGYNVLYPMGWDAFGLPTENYAIKNKIHPKEVTKQNVARFKAQLQSLGYSFDWDREINTTDPNYFKWTQWIFLKLFKAGLAYKSEMPINWCTSCKCGLANEEVVNGVCERCGSEVVRKVKSQWMLKLPNMQIN